MKFVSKPVGKWVLVLLMASSGLFVLQACNVASGQEDIAEDEVVTVPVEAATAEVGDIAAFYSGTATLEADERATIVSQTTGVVLEVLAEEGDFVKEGQVLARLETDRYQLEVQRAHAEYERLQTDFDRKKELFERELVSAEAFEQVRANLESARAEYDLAQLDLHYTAVRAPFSGYISERLVRVGNLVSNLEPVFRITSYNPLLAVLHVPERELSVLAKGLPVSVAVDAWPGELFEGEVTRISPVIDPETGTFRVTAEISDNGGKLKPGLFGRVQVLYDTHAGVTVIPRSAVISEDERSHVFVIAEDGTASKRAIELGYEKDGLVEITSGVDAGEQVVTAGKGSLNNGAAVEVIGSEA
ncbi:MAG: efflux RND transporter periplasmic adaptor subunit [Xanthomonadales bacterium]|nr:efflux RND transporter periplasmic adaptor subunit [Xanthomonadales bacterium]NIX12004.1 efflux RND transporter periplasmic adaptor subunit [Xanthomonadales bacterium]